MQVDIKGVYFEALEKIAKKYNDKTLDLWNEGKETFLRKKENAYTILPRVIMGYLRIEHPELYEELVAELDTRIAELTKKELPSEEERNEIQNCLDQKIEISEELIEGSR